jgi:hypothetical protein
MFGEGVFEEFEEVVGVLVVEKESGGGGAVLEMVQAGRGFESLIVCERHMKNGSFSVPSWIYPVERSRLFACKLLKN